MITARAEEKTLTINIHESIGYGWFDEKSEDPNNIKSVNELQALLDQNKNVNLIDIYINSPGGDVFDGIGIYNILKRSRAYKRVYVDGFACSIASVIAMCGNSISMPKSSLQMIHNASTYAAGNAAELRKTADDLDKINDLIIEAYMSRFKGTRDQLKALMDAESYLSAEECFSYGLCTKIVDDTEDTQKSVEGQIDQVTNLYANKLKQLEHIKASLKKLDAEALSVKSVNEPKGETGNDAGKVKETTGEMKKPEKPIEATVDEVKEEVKQLQATALQRFFNYKPKEKVKEKKDE